MDKLSPGERLIIEMIGDGRADAEIAVRMGTTVAAVRTRIAALLSARGLRDRHELAAAINDESALASGQEPTEANVARSSPGQRRWRLAWSVPGIALAGAFAAVVLWAVPMGFDEGSDRSPRAMRQAPVFDALSTEDEISMLDQSVRASPHEDGPAPWCRPAEDSADDSTPTAMGMVACGTKP